MKVSIQAAESFDSWSQVHPVIHDVETREEAISIAYAISKQMGCITVRVVIFEGSTLESFMCMTTAKSIEFIGKLSGTYIQSR